MRVTSTNVMVMISIGEAAQKEDRDRRADRVVDRSMLKRAAMGFSPFQGDQVNDDGRDGVN